MKSVMRNDIMSYTYEKLHDNGDATTSYNIKGNFPVRFSDFFKEILEKEGSFRIEFGSSNKKYGGWLGNRIEVYKNIETKKCYFVKRRPENWYEEIKDLMIKKCWADGGWGSMLYIVTFEE